MEKILADLKERFLTLETAEGATLLAVGAGIFLGGALGLLPYIAIGLMVFGGYKVWIKRDGK